MYVKCAVCVRSIVKRGICITNWISRRTICFNNFVIFKLNHFTNKNTKCLNDKNTQREECASIIVIMMTRSNWMHSLRCCDFYCCCLKCENAYSLSLWKKTDWLRVIVFILMVHTCTVCSSVCIWVCVRMYACLLACLSVCLVVCLYILTCDGALFFLFTISKHSFVVQLFAMKKNK